MRKQNSPNVFCNESSFELDNEVRGSLSAESDGEANSTKTSPRNKGKQKECHCEEICKTFKDELCSLFKDLTTSETQSEDIHTSAELSYAKNDEITDKMYQLDIESLENRTPEEKKDDEEQQQNASVVFESGSLLAAALPRIVVSHSQPGTSTSAPGPSGLQAAPAPGPCGLQAAPVPGPSGSQAAPPAPSPRDDEFVRDAGPPTPTHSESVDPHAPPLHLEQALPRRMEGLGSYSSVVGSRQQSSPGLSPGLAAWVRPELCAHVAGWPANMLEKQAGKFTDDVYNLSCMQCTRVTAELKCARAIVRDREIQATLQEQKLMYLRQQIARLNELKMSNSFLSDD